MSKTIEVLCKQRLFGELSFPPIVAGLVAVLVSYSGPFVVVLAAASAGGLTEAQTTSWVWAISIGSGMTCIGLSLWTRMPVITAWSTPGAALLVSSLAGYDYSAAVGAFVFAAVSMTLIGSTGVFGWLLARIPTGIVSAMLAGILLPFVLDAFETVPAAPLLTLIVFGSFILAKRLIPRYAVLIALLAGVGVAAATGQLGGLREVAMDLTVPVFTAPTFSLSALISIGVPLLLVTLASQNAPGLGVLRASGYEPNDRKLIGSTGLVSMLLAPFGSHAINLAAITAAICTGEEAHPNPRKRYVAGVACGVFYLVLGAFGTGLVQIFALLPKSLVAVVAGVALLGAVLSGLSGMIKDAPAMESALITLAVTASGLTMLSVGSAFWGLVAGMISYAVLTLWKKKRATTVITPGGDAKPSHQP